ncbi:MAG: hypothetical protein DMG77_16550 [Acidobacteria bacterium]|nr:MAG: hypothetical protein DMG77_16550 [Acidobacteriota bacterium]
MKFANNLCIRNAREEQTAAREVGTGNQAPSCLGLAVGWTQLWNMSSDVEEWTLQRRVKRACITIRAPQFTEKL